MVTDNRSRGERVDSIDKVGDERNKPPQGEVGGVRVGGVDRVGVERVGKVGGAGLLRLTGFFDSFFDFGHLTKFRNFLFRKFSLRFKLLNHLWLIYNKRLLI